MNFLITVSLVMTLTSVAITAFVSYRYLKLEQECARLKLEQKVAPPF